MSELSELFALDPLKHTTESLDKLIADLRGKRSQFSLENNRKAGKVKEKAAPTSKLATAGIKLNLDGVLKK